LLFCAACNGDGTPKGVLDEQTMTALLTQIHITDGSMYNVVQFPDSLYKYGINKYGMVFKSFHTDSNQFKQSMKYYAQHPDILEKMYIKIADDLKNKSDSLNKVYQAQMKEQNQRRLDSIKKLPKQQQGVVNPTATPTAPVSRPAPVMAKQPPAHFTNKRYLSKPQPNANPVK
jgi:hypothetical protein